MLGVEITADDVESLRQYDSVQIEGIYFIGEQYATPTISFRLGFDLDGKYFYVCGGSLWCVFRRNILVNNY